MAGTITLAGTNAAAARLLAQVLFDAKVTSIQSGQPWPFSPDGLDFTSAGNFQILIDGLTGKATTYFLSAPGVINPSTPSISGVIDLALLEAALSSPPNVVSNDLASPIGPAATLTFQSLPITRQKSGKIFVTGGWNGTQDAQGLVTAQLYRDYGLPGQVALDQWKIAPGGLTPYPFAGHHHVVDVLPDGAAHTYTITATSGGASNLSAGTGGADFDLFELGGPG